TLIAGTTGSGKSVLMQNLILDIAATNPPDLAKILLIDPKAGVDYFAFETLPHLSHGIVIERPAALEALQQVVDEMDQRYQQFRKVRVSKLAEYNAKVSPAERMPVRWVIHDEFAEWMMVDEYRDHVTQLVGRLGVKARAAGIFLIFAAQRPDANVMPMQLRDNLGNRLILRVESKGTSEICLGAPGAEHLLGKGHLAGRLEGETGLVYAQVPLLGARDLDAVIRTMTS
ncbi:MAG TPA: FtsK/SpoIIIE domain-containing protein, partial [Planctomycetota bacterium]|nr:FtsK/SpoIIIE domain-containing protein [Planctomycetota bacterium]